MQIRAACIPGLETGLSTWERPSSWLRRDEDCILSPPFMFWGRLPVLARRSSALLLPVRVCGRCVPPAASCPVRMFG